MISVIICTYSRAQHLKNGLEILEKQTLSQDKFEVIVVDNNSTDNTQEVCQDFEKNTSLNYTYYLEKKQGLSSARNRGLALAKGSIISFIDDDAIATEHFLEELHLFYDNYPNINCAGGKVEPVYEIGKEPEWLSKYLWGLVVKVDMGEEIIQYDKKYPAGCNMSFRKEIFDNYGGFNEDLTYRGDEKFFFHKLKENNEPFYYVPKAKVFHFIEEKRTSKEGVIKLSLAIGESEKIRLKHSKSKLSLKLLEYFFKFGASLLIGLKYWLENEKMKAKYLIMTRKYAIKGFIRTKT